MFHGVQARNQIFLGEFQLSDKVGCILAYPGSYPPTIPYRTPQVPPGNTPLGCIVVGAAIPLPLGRVNPSVAAWIICTRPIRIPILLRQNAHCKGGVTSTKKNNIMMKISNYILRSSRMYYLHSANPHSHLPRRAPRRENERCKYVRSHQQ